MRYYRLKRDIKTSEHRDFVANNLIALRAALEHKVPKKRLDKNLLLATWNIRDFDSNKFKHGPRLKESFYYIAQIVSAFDLVAIQEVNNNLTAFKNLIYLLGPHWDYIITDLTEGSSGNQERMAFVYDRRRVTFKKIAGEIVLPRNQQIKGDVQFARTPFLVSFQSGWSKFNLCAVHIYFGDDSGALLERRRQEIEGIAKFLKKRADKDKETMIVLGDFNIIDHDHDTMKALLDNGFKIPEQIRTNPITTNAKMDKYYDQIGIRSKSELFKLEGNANSAGAVNIFDKVFKGSNFMDYRDDVIASVNVLIANKEKALLKEQNKANPDPSKVSKLEKGLANLQERLADDDKLKHYYSHTWKTFQMSDHFPLYTEILIDQSDDYLRTINNVSINI